MNTAKTSTALIPLLSPDVAGQKQSQPLNTTTLDTVIDATNGTESGDWVLFLGIFNSRQKAKDTIIKATLTNATFLGDKKHEINRKHSQFEASITDLTRKEAEKSCQSLLQKGMPCVALLQNNRN